MPVSTAAIAIGNSGSRKRVIPDVALIPAALSIQKVSAALHAGVLRATRINSGANTTTMGPKYYQNPEWAGSIPTKKINFIMYHTPLNFPAPGYARKEATQ